MKGRLLSAGRCAEVYEWGEKQVIKIFHPEFGADAEYEFRNNQSIQNVNVPCPMVEATREIDGLPAIIFERVNGLSMLEHVLTHPSSLNEMSLCLGQIHAKMHSRSCTSLPLQVDYLRHKIERADIAEGVRVKALYCLEQLPQEDKLCHGDFHPGNVMITQSAPVVIDWVTATQGNPLADIVWTRLLLALDNLPEGVTYRETINTVRPMLDAGYRSGYNKVRNIDDELLHPWIHPVAVARLGDGLLSERQQLLSIIQKYSNDND